MTALELARRLLTPSLVEDTWEEVERRLLENTAQLWFADDFSSAMVTEVMTGNRIHVWLGGGKLSTLNAMRERVEAWARAAGCTHATIHTRKGWARVLRSAGFVRDGDLLRKEL